jgi:hypothetical protein
MQMHVCCTQTIIWEVKERDKVRGNNSSQQYIYIYIKLDGGTK